MDLSPVKSSRTNDDRLYSRSVGGKPSGIGVDATPSNMLALENSQTRHHGIEATAASDTSYLVMYRIVLGGQVMAETGHMVSPILADLGR